MLKKIFGDLNYILQYIFGSIENYLIFKSKINIEVPKEVSAAVSEATFRVPPLISGNMSELDKILEDFRKTFAEKFITRRAANEGFDPTAHSFYKHDFETQFLSVILTGYFIDHYYMSGKEVLANSIPLHKKMIEKNSENYLTALEIARNCGMKDQVLLGLCLFSRNISSKEQLDRFTKLFNSFPPNQIVKKFINAKRKAKIGGGLVDIDKSLITKYLQEIFKSEYKTLKYRKYLKQMVNLVHYKDAPKLLFKRLSAYSGSDYIEKVKKVIFEKKFPKFEDEKMPFELVRSSVPKKLWSEWIISNTDLTGHTLLLQAISLCPYIKDFSVFDKILRTPYITSDQILKVAAESKNLPKLARKFAELYAKKVTSTYKELLLPIQKPNIILLLDGSGSMNPKKLNSYYFKSLATISPLAPLIKSLVIFSEDAQYADPRLLLSYEGLKHLMNIAPSGGTNITSALELALKSEEEVVILVTDEQANILTDITTAEMQYIKKLLNRGRTVIIINPTPYPVSIADIRDKRIIYLRADSPEALVNAIKLEQIRSSNKSAEELLTELKKKLKKKIS